MFDVRRVRRFTWAVSGTIALLAAANVGVLLLRDALGNPDVLDRMRALDLNHEQSLGTWLAAALHAVCALLAVAALATEGARGSPWRWNWWLLAAVFMLMSVDEVAALHEYANRPMRGLLHAGGVLYYAWIVPALLAAFLFALAELRWLRRLPADTARRLVVAGAVFVGAAAGIELVESKLLQNGSIRDLDYRLVSTVQEVLELAGLALAARALGLHLAKRRLRLRLSWS